jgi:hypothetical protein
MATPPMVTAELTSNKLVVVIVENAAEEVVSVSVRAADMVSVSLKRLLRVSVVPIDVIMLSVEVGIVVVFLNDLSMS